MPVRLNQLTEEWGWTLESEAAYKWAVGRLKTYGVTGRVADIGGGCGEGARMLRDAGYNVVVVEKKPLLVESLKSDGFDVLEMSYNRQKVRGQGWGAVVMVSILGYYAEPRKLLYAAMHDAPILLATVAEDYSVDTAWMKPQPTITPNGLWSYMEWSRAGTK